MAIINNFLSRSERTCLINVNPVPTSNIAIIKRRPRKLKISKMTLRLCKVCQRFYFDYINLDFNKFF